MNRRTTSTNMRSPSRELPRKRIGPSPRRLERARGPRDWCRELLGEDLVELGLGGVLVKADGEGKLGQEDLAGLAEHALLAGREALVLLTDREVPDDLGNLVDVAALQLLDVVLERPGPVRRHPGLLLAEDREHLLDLFVVDDVAQADLLGVV